MEAGGAAVPGSKNEYFKWEKITEPKIRKYNKCVFVKFIISVGAAIARPGAKKT